jgi:hypothetical protein
LPWLGPDSSGGPPSVTPATHESAEESLDWTLRDDYLWVARRSLALYQI